MTLGEIIVSSFFVGIQRDKQDGIESFYVPPILTFLFLSCLSFSSPFSVAERRREVQEAHGENRRGRARGAGEEGHYVGGRRAPEAGKVCWRTRYKGNRRRKRIRRSNLLEKRNGEEAMKKKGGRRASEAGRGTKVNETEVITKKVKKYNGKRQKKARNDEEGEGMENKENTKRVEGREEK